MSTSAAMLAASPVTASIAVTSLETMLAAVRLSSAFWVVSDWLFLPQPPRASAAPAMRRRARIRGDSRSGTKKRLPASTGSLLKSQRPRKPEASRRLHCVVGRRSRRVGRRRRVHVRGVHGVHVRRVHVRRRRRVHVSRREILIDVHGVVGVVVAAARSNRQGRTSDQDKSTHSRLPIYCDLRAVSRPANRADNSLKRKHPSRLFALSFQTTEKRTETALQGRINPRHGYLFPKLGEACDPIFGNAAWHD